MSSPGSDAGSTAAGALPLRVFLSYASEDDAQRIELMKFIKPLVREGLLELWHDRKLLPGDRFDDVIAEQLDEADFVLLLVSQDFLDSDYIHEKELARALEREAKGEIRVVAVLLNHCTWATSPLAGLHVLPDRARPVLAWPNAAEAWLTVADGIRRVAAEHLAMRAPPAAAGGPTTPGLRAVDATRYLEFLREEHSWLDIRGMGAQVTEKMELRQVYTRLTVIGGEVEDRRQGSKPGASTEGPIAGHPRSDPGWELRPERELREVLARHRHIVLVGDPGSGKTTFLRYVAQNLARAHLGESGALTRLGLEEAKGTPFPVFLRLERFAKYLDKHPEGDLPDDAPEHLYRYLDFQVAGHPHALPPDYLSKRVRAGGCFVLLDGLDEVPGSEMRSRMVQLIGKVVIAGSESNRHMVTCRTRAYQGLTQLREGVTTFRLAPFRRPQVEQFVDGWSRALHRVETSAPEPARVEQAKRYAAELLAAIDQNPSGATFSASPLMLTVLAVVHWSRKKLPEQRAELYDAALGYLLDSRSELADHPVPLRRECLQAVAWAMFNDPEGVQRSLGDQEAADSVAPLLGTGRSEALAFLEGEELHSGILVSRTEGEVEFWHPTFGEYLAALELSQDDEGWGRLEDHIADDRWAEVALLYAGCVRRLRGTRAARSLLENVLTTGSGRVGKARAVALVSRMLKDLRPYGRDPAQGTPYETMLSETLGIFEPRGEVVEEPVRVEVGEALGMAGDPRLDEPEKNRVLVPSGSFQMGAQAQDQAAPGYDADAFPDEAPVHTVHVSAVLMGRFPVTVQEYAAFVEAGDHGYLNRRFWEPAGWALRERSGWTSPAGWTEQEPHLNRPVTGVSWFEADAYCRWVGGRLPTEAEWEWAARGAEGRRYPWGDSAPSRAHANFDMSVGQPTPVGIYPFGVSYAGIRDLAGNVWEWCQDRWHPNYDGAPIDGSAWEDGGTERRVLRGGSFDVAARNLRAAYRSNFLPDIRSVDFGFRVVWSAAGAQD